MEQRVVFLTREMQAIEARTGRSIEELLRELYVERGLTLREVADELGVTFGAVSRWLERFGIPTRRSGQKAAVA